MILEPLHELIIEFIEKTNRPIFMTGKAGTGKTTFLRYLRNNTQKNLAVVAPTAVAAINAGGMTIHSFFQVPFGPIIPPNLKSSVFTEFSGKNFAPEKAKLLKCLELLIIDEISMVRADTIDYIDRTLQMVRGNKFPFGGVQLLMIGDLYQLPPVFQNDWHLLSKFYQGPYFFQSLSFQKHPVIVFELTKVHRQNDPIFIDILNGVRAGALNETQLQHLNSQYQAQSNNLVFQDYVTLTTHNALVKTINEQRLEALPEKSYTFQAEISGEFPVEAYPADEKLELKVGALVMFIKNDSSGQQQYYNGKTAKIESLSETQITVSFADHDIPFEVKREAWENNKYSLSQQDQKVTQTTAGTFSQFPLRLAWAITIHKSQGLTFEKAVVDVSAAFAHGQTYVALSRCRSLEGLILQNPVTSANIITDNAVIQFMNQTQAGVPNQLQLQESVSNHQDQQLLESFDFNYINNAYQILQNILLELLPHEPLLISKLHETNSLLSQKIDLVAQRFSTKELSESNSNPANPAFNKRIQQAAAYFLPQIQALKEQLTELHQLAEGIPYHTDYFPIMNWLQEQLEIKLQLFRVFQTQFDLKTISEIKKSVAVNYQNIDSWKTVAPPKVIENPKLYEELVQWRQQKAEKNKVLSYHILSDAALADISAKLPKSIMGLSKIKNIGEGKATVYGDELMRMVKSHLGESDLFG